MALPHLCILWGGVRGNQVVETTPAPPVPGALNVSKIERSMDHIGALSGLGGKAVAKALDANAVGSGINHRVEAPQAERSSMGKLIKRTLWPWSHERATQGGGLGSNSGGGRRPRRGVEEGVDVNGRRRRGV